MRKFFYITLILLILTLGLLFFLKKDEVVGQGNSEDSSEDYIEVVFLDIGQGDATLITWPGGVDMLVDCAIDARVLEALGRNMDFYDKHLDYLLVTHPDLDHYGGCIDVLDRFEIGHIVYNGDKKEFSDTWQAFFQKIKDEGAEYTEVKEFSSWEINSSTITFLYPDHSIEHDPNVPGSDKDTGANNASIIFKLSYGNVDLLMTGDAEAELEEYLIGRYNELLDVEILKLAHHGSSGSSIQEFIDLSSPEVAIASAGVDNKYNHPSLRVIRRVERVSSTVWRTDRDGDILLKIGRNEYEVESRN